MLLTWLQVINSPKHKLKTLEICARQVLSVPANNRAFYLSMVICARGVSFTSSEPSLYLYRELWKNRPILIQTGHIQYAFTDIHIINLEMHWNKRKEQEETDCIFNENVKGLFWSACGYAQIHHTIVHSILYYFKRKEKIYPTHTLISFLVGVKGCFKQSLCTKCICHLLPDFSVYAGKF